MAELEKEMIAIIYFRDCGEKHYNNVKSFIFEFVFNGIKHIDWEISKDDFSDIKRSIEYIRCLAKQNIDNKEVKYKILINK